MDSKDPYCDLEHNARELAQEITDQQQTLQVDLRSIDRQLLILAQRFQEAVEKGYKIAAFAAIEGLTHGIDEIRCRVPQKDLTFCSQYIEVNTNYLKEWVQLADLAKGLDLMRENVERRKEDYRVAQEEEKKQIENLREELETNDQKRKLFNEICRQEKSGERSSWPDEEERRELCGKLIMLRFKQADLDLQYCLVKQEENRLNFQKGRTDALKEKLNGLPVIQDPNQLDALQNALQKITRKTEMGPQSVEFDETLSGMNQIKEQLLQMQNAEGDPSAMEAVLQQTEEVLKRFREEEETLRNAGEGKSRQK